MHPERTVIALADWTQRTPARTFGEIRRRARMRLGLGVVLVLLALAGLVALVLGSGPLELAVGVVVLGAVGGLALWSARRELRAGRGRADDEVAVTIAPYAFALHGDAIEFPATAFQPAEQWPLAQVDVSIRRAATGEAVQLQGPGRTRRYPGRGLQRPPVEVVALLEEHRRRALGRPDRSS